MFAFSEMASDPKMMYAMGYSYITFVLILVCGNIAFLILKEIERQHRKRQLIMQQELWKQLLI